MSANLIETASEKSVLSPKIIEFELIPGTNDHTNVNSTGIVPLSTSTGSCICMLISNSKKNIVPSADHKYPNTANPKRSNAQRSSYGHGMTSK